jgi:hypothetical protein
VIDVESIAIVALADELQVRKQRIFKILKNQLQPHKDAPLFLAGLR